MSASAPAPPPVAKERTLPLPRYAQLSLAFLLGVIFLLLGQHVWQRCLKADRPLNTLKTPLDVNLASRAELQQLDGVGPALAGRIVEHREKNGPFADVGQLKDVKGIGPSTVDRLRPQLQSGSRASATGPRAPAQAFSSKAKSSQPVDLNRATRAQLIDLDGIGPVLADRIIAHRQSHGPFRRVEDLTQIKGIKAKTLEKVRPFVFVEEPKVAQGRDGA